MLCVVSEHSSVPAAQFHAVSLLQAALLERWEALGHEERAWWRTYLAQFLFTHFDR
jgi:hypothetical protein